jgi:hypothetical protein
LPEEIKGWSAKTDQEPEPRQLPASSGRRSAAHAGGVAVLRGGLKNGVFTTFARTR